jgi:hypothetical protein
MTHPATFKDPHEILVHAQSDEHERERDPELQCALETRCSLSLHEVVVVPIKSEDDVIRRRPGATLALYTSLAGSSPIVGSQ